MNKRERLAILIALEKAVKQAAQDARADIEQELFEEYEQNGVDRIQMQLGGVKVGTLTVCKSKEHEDVKPYVADVRKTAAYLFGEGSPHFMTMLENDLPLVEYIARTWLDQTGEELPGIGFRHVTTGGKLHTRASVNAKKVAEYVRTSPLPVTELLELTDGQ